MKEKEEHCTYSEEMFGILLWNKLSQSEKKQASENNPIKVNLPLLMQTQPQSDINAHTQNAKT